MNSKGHGNDCCCGCYEINERTLFNQYLEEKAIVDRIWEIFGNPSLEELKGRSIFDLILDLKKDNDILELDLECLYEKYKKLQEQLKT